MRQREANLRARRGAAFQGGIGEGRGAKSRQAGNEYEYDCRATNSLSVSKLRRWPRVLSCCASRTAWSQSRPAKFVLPQPRCNLATARPPERPIIGRCRVLSHSPRVRTPLPRDARGRAPAVRRTAARPDAWTASQSGGSPPVRKCHPGARDQPCSCAPARRARTNENTGACHCVGRPLGLYFTMETACLLCQCRVPTTCQIW